MDLNAMDRAKVIGKKQLREITNVSYPTWWRMERKQEAPARIRVSAGRVGWRLGDVLDWLETRKTVEG